MKTAREIAEETIDKAYDSCTPDDDLIRITEIGLLESIESALKEYAKPAVEALDKLSKLGNEPRVGNSIGNTIAAKTLTNYKDV